MKRLGQLRLLAVLVSATCALCMPQNPTARQSRPIDDTIKQVTHQLFDLNTTSQMTFDTRTPPRIMEKIESREDYHPGVAEPIDEDTILLDEPVKNLNYYKVDKGTTDSGLSTWILLSGQGSTTTKPPRKAPVVKNVTTTFIAEDAHKIIKPIFKRKNVTTTKKPATSTTQQPEKTTKLTKIKASVLTSAMNKNKNEVFASEEEEDYAAAALVNTTPKPAKKNPDAVKKAEAAALKKQQAENVAAKKPMENLGVKKPVENLTVKKPVEHSSVKKTTDAPSFIKKTSEYLTVKKTVTEVPASGTKKAENISKKTTEAVATKKTAEAGLTKKTTEAVPIKKTSDNSNLHQGTKEVTKKTSKTTTEAPMTKNTKPGQTTEFVKITTKTPLLSNETLESNSVLGPEAKDAAVELPASSKKTRKPATTTATTTSAKKKKVKSKKKKHTADDKADTKVSHKHKEKPFGTQIYNYLSREVMPTVGVGLVGLMVTAGLASYFLYPFSPVRRSYEVDRKDKVAPYYYKDEYSGGIAEEEAIGKVIAGMPSNSNAGLPTSAYNRQHNSRNSFQNRYRQVDQRYMQGSVETVAMNPHAAYKIEEVIVGSPKKDFADGEKRFVVGNVPKQPQEVSTVGTIVPEHGPRTIEQDGVLVAKKSQMDMEKENESMLVDKRDKLEASPVIFEHGPRNFEKTETPFNTQTHFEPRHAKPKPKNAQPSEEVFVVHSVPATTETYTNHQPRYVRMRRQATHENEIDNDVLAEEQTTQSSINREASTITTTTTSTKHPLLEKTESILELIKDLFYYKMRLGLQLLQNKTESLSRYFKRVQDRIDENYREQNRDTM